MYSILLRFKPIHKAFHVCLILVCFGYLTNSCCESYQPIDVVPIYRDAIKAVDPLDKLREGDAIHDYVTF